jgi:hypothetical protein
MVDVSYRAIKIHGTEGYGTFDANYLMDFFGQQWSKSYRFVGVSRMNPLPIASLGIGNRGVGGAKNDALYCPHFRIGRSENKKIHVIHFSSNG